MITVDQFMDIKELKQQGHSIRDIAQLTGHSRNTVRKVLRGEHTMKVKSAPRASRLDEFKEYLRTRYEEHRLSAVRLLAEIKPMGYTGGLATLRRFLRTLKCDLVRQGKLTVRFETPPGRQAQADWAYCGRFPTTDGKLIPVYCFVMVLSFSRMLFVRFTTSMRMWPAVCRGNQWSTSKAAATRYRRSTRAKRYTWPRPVGRSWSAPAIASSPSIARPLHPANRSSRRSIWPSCGRSPSAKCKCPRPAADQLRGFRRANAACAIRGGADMMSIAYEAKAADGLAQLGLSAAREQLDTAAAEAWSYTHFLGYLLDGELHERQRKCVELNLKFARFPYRKRLEDFDFAAQPGLDRRVVDELATGRFLHEGRNVVLLGPSGVGKTHLAIALGMRTAELGHRVYFTTAIDLAARLTKAVDTNRLHRQLNTLVQPKLLVIDEVGYLSSIPCNRASLFQVMCQRYQRGGAIALTSNKAFSEWGQVFADDAVLASAALDRLLLRARLKQVAVS
jgi:DNA replication protein DnaC